MTVAIGNKKGVSSDPNVVPLIDILLVLVVVFMVISPVTSKGLDTLVPQRALVEEPPAQAATVVVQVTAAGKVMVNQRETGWDQLGLCLSDIFKSRAEKVAFVRGDDSVEFGEVARAVGIMRSAGVEKVGLLTEAIGTKPGNQ